MGSGPALVKCTLDISTWVSKDFTADSLSLEHPFYLGGGARTPSPLVVSQLQTPSLELLAFEVQR